ncbi:MAG TPA: hypothetical protein VNH11_25110 [Pirellulales bacterium]|nr:hypothetical protein [Pirellulales bacterium]
MIKELVLVTSALLTYTTAAWPNGALAQRPAATRVAQAAPRGGQPENRWRYQWHNDRWWYWSHERHWSYFNGRRWVRYDARRPPSGALAGGYRKAPAFDSPPAAPPEPPRTWSAAGDMERETGLTNSFYLEGAGRGLPLGEPLPVLGGPSPLGTGLGPHAGPSGLSEGMSPSMRGPSQTGGGSFGGPTGRSLGAGSAAGGASTPH